MNRASQTRRRRIGHITPAHAARLYRLVSLLDEDPRRRDEVLKRVGIAIRTFYREIALLDRCGVAIRRDGKEYALGVPFARAEGCLPFPDPRLSFAELRELASHPCDAGRRLAGVLDRVLGPPQAAGRQERRAR